MSDASQEVRRIRWSECFGFMHLFQAFRVSIKPTSLALAFCGLVCMCAAGGILDLVWPEANKPVVVNGISELDKFITDSNGGRTATITWIDGLETEPQRVGAFDMLLSHLRTSTYQATDAVLSLKVGSLLHVVRRGLMAFVWLPAMHPLYAALFFFSMLVIWAWFGGAISRYAALYVTREERLNMRQALRFARQRLLSFILAPVLPIGLLIAAMITFFFLGLLYLVPWVGEALSIFLGLLVGFGTAYLVICWIPGLPLMYPTIAMEGSDGFDAISRSSSFIQQRPWRAAFYALVSVFYGSICLVFVKFFARLTLWITHHGLSMSADWGSVSTVGADGVETKVNGGLTALWKAPELFGNTPFWGNFADVHLTWSSAVSHWIVWIWVMVVVGFVGAFAVNFYFSSCTLIYGLLRREVDATDIDDVYLEEQESDDLAPVAQEPQQISRNDDTGDTSLPVIGQ